MKKILILVTLLLTVTSSTKIMAAAQAAVPANEQSLLAMFQAERKRNHRPEFKQDPILTAINLTDATLLGEIGEVSSTRAPSFQLAFPFTQASLHLYGYRAAFPQGVVPSNIPVSLLYKNLKKIITSDPNKSGFFYQGTHIAIAFVPATGKPNFSVVSVMLATN